MATLKSLTACEEPKLEPFTQNLAANDVEFIKIVKAEELIHRFVIKTKIDGNIYALKLVRTSDNPGVSAVAILIC